MRFLVLLLFSFSVLYSFPRYDVRGNYSENYLHLQGKVKLKLKDNFFENGEDIKLDFTVKNFGKEPIRIFPGIEDYKTFQLVVTDENDDTVLIREDIRIKDKKQEKRSRIVNLTGNTIKEVVIHPNESFTRRFHLNELFQLEPGKKYYITGYFYPNHSEDKTAFLKSQNIAHFYLNKSKQEKHKKFQDSEIQTDGITPEEIIYLFLGAEMKKNWKNYFKYIYFPEYILSYSKFAKEYASQDDESKELVIEEFKNYLTESKAGRLKNYKVLSSQQISPNLTRVNVLVEREQNRATARYEYFFTLKKNESTQKGFWKITGLVAKVKK